MHACGEDRRSPPPPHVLINPPIIRTLVTPQSQNKEEAFAFERVLQYKLKELPFGIRLWQRTGAGNPHPTEDQPPGTWFFVFITFGTYKEEPARGADGGYSTATLIPLAKHSVPDVFGAVVPDLAVKFHAENAHD
jgi:hypothetical protein